MMRTKLQESYGTKALSPPAGSVLIISMVCFDSPYPLSTVSPIRWQPKRCICYSSRLSFQPASTSITRFSAVLLQNLCIRHTEFMRVEAATLSPLTFWKLDLSLPWTTFEQPLWFITAFVNKLVSWATLSFEWHSRNFEITIEVNLSDKVRSQIDFDWLWSCALMAINEERLCASDFGLLVNR